MGKELAHKVFYAGPSWKLCYWVELSDCYVRLGIGLEYWLNWAGLILYLGPLSLGLGADRKWR